MSSEDLAKSAREFAAVLERDMAWQQGYSGGSYWGASEQAESKVRARAVAALGFLDQFAALRSAVDELQTARWGFGMYPQSEPESALGSLEFGRNVMTKYVFR